MSERQEVAVRQVSCCKSSSEQQQQQNTTITFIISIYSTEQDSNLMFPLPQSLINKYTYYYTPILLSSIIYYYYHYHYLSQLNNLSFIFFLLLAMNKNKFPFTPSQWQELEHQALVYKYMASGISIPPDLLFTIRKSFLDSPLSSRLLPNTQQHHFGWNYLQMGLGRKIDPEPGRCRRTDGKKWRCSKEAYPDSKYCERHMHRGKNRSRKPVEVLKTTTNNASTFANSSITKNSSSLSFDTQQHQNYPQNSIYGSNLQHSFMYPQTTSRSSASSGIGLSFEDNSASLFLDSNSCSQNNGDYRNRYVYGQKEEVDEYAFFKEPSGSTTMKSFSASSMEHDPWQLTPLTMSSSSSSSSLRQRSFSSLSNDYSCLQLQSLNEHSKQQEQEEPQKIVHRFFDELPHKGRDQWLDLDDKSSTTQLSISIPSSAHDFPTFTSRNQHDG